MRLPVIMLPRVLHVGTMDPSDLGSSGLSQEGASLSVSLCPDAWTRIAKLGGRPLHELTNPVGAFLDVRAMLADADLVAEAFGWAGREGLVEERTVWRADRFDDELDDWSTSHHETRESAIEEADVTGEHEDDPDGIPGRDGRPGIAEVALTIGTPALSAITGMRLRADEDATDAVVMAWAMAVATPALDGALDGLWWRERLDPSAYSAPKGCVFPDRVRSWASTPVVRSAGDAREMSRMPATVHVEVGEPSPCASASP